MNEMFEIKISVYNDGEDIISAEPKIVIKKNFYSEKLEKEITKILEDTQGKLLKLGADALLGK